MKKIYILFSMIIVMVVKPIHSDSSDVIPFPIPNTITYPSTQATAHQYQQETPLENHFSEILSVNKDDIDTFDSSKKSAIPFFKKENASDPDSTGILGYFWDMKNSNDKLQYGGIARVEQERYVNVVAIPSDKVSRKNQTETMNAQNDAQKAKSGHFDPGRMPYIGTFYGKLDGKKYYLYGRYVNTIMPVDSLDTNGNYAVENM